VRRLLLLTAVLTLHACSILDLQDPFEKESNNTSLYLQKRGAQLLDLQNWSIEGRVGFRFKNQAWHASMYWEQQSSNFKLALYDLFGRKIAEVFGDSHQTILRTKEGEEYSAPDSQVLLRKYFGFSFPVHGMRYWLMGISSPNSKVSELSFNKSGLPDILVQDGWRISYIGYDVYQRIKLPSRIQFNKENLELKIAVKNWNL